MQRLTGVDATFLYLETPTTHMHVASTAVFDPADVPEGYSFEHVKKMVENRLPLLPPFRRRLVEVPFRCTIRCGSRIPTSTSTTTCVAPRS